MVRLGIALIDRKNDQPLQSLCNFRSTAMFSLLLTFNLFTPQNTAFITASGDTLWEKLYSDYYSNETDYYDDVNDDNNASYYDGDCELGFGRNYFFSNHMSTGEIYDINVEYNYEIFAREEGDSLMTEIRTVETQLSSMLLPLLFPDECADPDTRSGGNTLDDFIGMTSDPPDVVDDSGALT